MLKKRIIPCLDVRGGRIVKGIKFQNLRDAGDPVEQARQYDQQGADELVILDVSATAEERLATDSTIADVRDVLTIPLTVGGGVRSVDDARRLLNCGADKVSVNTAAVEKPELIAELAAEFGAQCTVVAIDAARRLSPASTTTMTGGDPMRSPWQVVTRSGTVRHELDAIAWAVRCQQLGAGEILLTSWDRDGTGTGYDVDLLTQLTTATPLPVIASGGANTVAHMQQALEHGAHAVLAATIFHDRHTTVADVKRQLCDLGVAVRLESDL